MTTPHRGERVSDWDLRPIFSTQIVLQRTFYADDLLAKCISACDSMGFKGTAEYYPEEESQTTDRRFVVKVEIDPDDPRKNLVIEPRTDGEFIEGQLVSSQLTLESIYRVRLPEGEKMHSSFSIADEMQPYIEEVGRRLEAQLT